MGKAYITDHIKDPYIEREILGENLSLIINDEIEVLLVWLKDIDSNYMDRFPNLKGIVRYGVGFDNVDIEYAKNKDIYVCNVPDYGTDEVSDSAIAMIMNITRGISAYDCRCRNDLLRWPGNTLNSIKRTSDIKLGVIGAGRIGGSVILKANSLRFNTFFYDPYVPRGYEKTLNSERIENIEELLKISDIISLHCPLNNETKGMINKGFIELMKKGSSIVNTARGKIIENIDILYEPLKKNHLNCVALDVLPEEPPLSSKLINAWTNREEWLDGRLIINPHTAFFSKKSYFELRSNAANIAKMILEGKKPYNVVNE